MSMHAQYNQTAPHTVQRAELTMYRVAVGSSYNNF